MRIAATDGKTPLLSFQNLLEIHTLSPVTPQAQHQPEAHQAVH
jgi:hypothetical protein